MANILNQTVTNDGFRQTAKLIELTVTLDSTITTAEINNYLPNNGTRYSDSIMCIPSGSSATILTTTSMIVCTFIAENGSINSITGRQEGIWKAIANVSFL